MDDLSDRNSMEPGPHGLLDLEALEQEIARLWRPESAANQPDSVLPTRTSVLNLIVYAADGELADHARTAAERLSATHSCRVVLFRMADSEDPSVPKATFETTCHQDSQQPNAPCYECIEIRGTPAMIKQLPAIVRPLIIPELPAFLWWPGSPPLSDPGFRALVVGAHRTVVDSLRFTQPRQLSEFHQVGASLPVGCALADLNWQRLQPWRELTAQYFDIRHVQWALSCVREIEIETGQQSDKRLPEQALLFACWMSHCLGWEVFEARRTRNDRWYIGARDQQGETIRIMIRTRPAGSEYAGHLLSLSVNARSKDGESSSLSLSRSRGSALIRMHAKSGLDTALHHAVHHPLLPDEALLIPVLESTINDHVFEAALRHAAAVLELSGRSQSG